MPAKHGTPDLSLWNPPGMAATELCGSIVLVVLAMRFGDYALAEPTTARWWSGRAWAQSGILAALFLVGGVLVPRAIPESWIPRASHLRVLPFLAGLGLFAWVFAHVIHRGSSGRPAGVVAGIVATMGLAILVVGWAFAVGVFFLGPGLI